MSLDESQLELAALDWFIQLGFDTAHGPDLSPEGITQERDSFGDILLRQRLQAVIARLNPTIPTEGLDEAFRKITRLDGPTLIARNRQFHNWLRDGVEVEFRRADGSIAGDRVQLIDFNTPESNEFLAVNQFAVREGNHKRVPDVVVFVNGLPLALIELKNPADEAATIDDAFNQLQTYKAEIPSLFDYNELLVISDGGAARIGSLTANMEWFKPWPTIDDDRPVKGKLPLEVLIRGVFQKEHFLQLVRNFVVFEDDPDSDRVFKVLAGYHQFHAARKAIDSTIAATREGADHRCGVVWHTHPTQQSDCFIDYWVRNRR